MAPESYSTTIGSEQTLSNVKSHNFQLWLAVYGGDEYALYKEHSATPHLTYEEWTTSEHVLGPYLYRVTLDAWDEASSSDEELELPVNPSSSDQPARIPAESMRINGRQALNATKSSTPTAEAELVEPSASTKKRQRRRKKFLSDAIITQGDFDDSAASAAESKPERRRAFIERSKNTSPAHSIAPEDIQEPTPVANAASPGPAAVTPDGPTSASSSRRGLRNRTPAQRRPYFHHRKLFEEETDEAGEPGRFRRSPPKLKSRLSEVSYPEVEEDDSEEQEPEPSEEDEHMIDGEPVTYIDDDVDFDQFSSLPLPLSPPRPRMKTFKGKGRAWKKDEDDEDEDYQQGWKPKKPKIKTTTRKQPKAPRLTQPQIKREMDTNDAEQVDSRSRTAVEMSLQQQKTQKTPRKSRKSHLSAEFVQDDSDSGAESPAAHPVQDAIEGGQGSAMAMLSPSSTTALAERPKRKPRKSYLSQEFIGEDSDVDDVEVIANNAHSRESSSRHSLELNDRLISSPKPTSKPKQRRRSRKRYVSNEFVNEDSDQEVQESPQPPSLIVKLRVPFRENQGEKEKVKRRPRARKHISEEFVHDESESDLAEEGDTSTGVIVAPTFNETPKSKSTPKNSRGGSQPSSSTKVPAKRGRPRKIQPPVKVEPAAEEEQKIGLAFEQGKALAGGTDVTTAEGSPSAKIRKRKAGSFANVGEVF